MLSRADILAIVPTLRREEVELSDWGGSVHVREMNGAERDRFELLLLEGKRANFRSLLAAFTVCDADGRRVFGEADAATLAEQPARVLDVVSTVALKLNSLSEAELDAARGKSDRGPSDGSS